MSYNFKSKKIIFNGEEVELVPKSLPSNPNIGNISIDINDNKLKAWNGSRWIILGDAGDIKFDNSNNTFISTNLQDAIIELNNTINNLPRTISLELHKNGYADNAWLTIGNAGIPSNKSPYAPPFNCKIKEVTFSNRNSGKSWNEINTKLEARSIDYMSTSNIKTNSTLSWYISSDPNLNRLAYAGYGKRWTYDCTNDNDEMHTDRAYGFRLKQLGGHKYVQDVIITIILEEIV